MGAPRSHRANAEPEVQGAGAAPHSGGTPATSEVRERGPGAGLDGARRWTFSPTRRHQVKEGHHHPFCLWTSEYVQVPG